MSLGLLLVAECKCHYWIVVGSEYGRCGMCNERPKIIGDARPDAKTTCKHEGVCEKDYGNVLLE